MRLVDADESGAEAGAVITRNGRPAAPLPIRLVTSGDRIGIAKSKFAMPDTIDAVEAAVAALFTT